MYAPSTCAVCGHTALAADAVLPQNVWPTEKLDQHEQQRTQPPAEAADSRKISRVDVFRIIEAGAVKAIAAV